MNNALNLLFSDFESRKSINLTEFMNFKRYDLIIEWRHVEYHKQEIRFPCGSVHLVL